MNLSSSEIKELALDINKLTSTNMEEEMTSSKSTDMGMQMPQLSSTEMEEEMNSSKSTDMGMQMPWLSSTEMEEEMNSSHTEMEQMYTGVNPEEAGLGPGPGPSHTPCLDLLNGIRADYFRYCVPLFRASITGDWDAAEFILRQRPTLVRYAITEDYNTPLHVAASVGTSDLMENFVEKLVRMMDLDDLTLQNRYSNTALWLAAAAGNVKFAQIMLAKNSKLLHVRGNQGMFPMYAAAVYERDNMVRYLFDASGLSTYGWTPTQRGSFLQKCMECDIFDISWRVVDLYPKILPSTCVSILRILAGKPDALFTVKRRTVNRMIQLAGPAEYDSDALKILKLVWKSIVSEKLKPEVDRILRGPPDDALSDQISTDIRYSSRILFIAAEAGNTRFLVELFQSYPDLIWQKNDDNLSIFHIAIMHRHQGIYNLLYEVGSLKDQIIHLMDQDGNNMLHLVGKTSKEMRPLMVEASLVMQRELLWFMAVEKMLPPISRKSKNKAGQTPYELFSHNNKDIVSRGLKRMKESMVVATLIVTVAFAVAFTVPGGYSQDYGRPYFLKRSTFIVFVIADGICLFSSSASLLMFLSILTSRYNERHFLYSLPKKLMIALFFLFISVLAMMATFSASFFVLYHKGLRWIALVISGFVAIPVIIFAMLEIPVLVDICRSVYDNRYLFNPRSRMLCFPQRDSSVLHVARSIIFKVSLKLSSLY